MGEELTEEQRIYERLWTETGPLLKSGRLQIDPFLRNRAGDDRRGVTLVALPDVTVKRNVEEFLRGAAAICPGQYFYNPAELHVTVMAIIPGSERWRDEMQQLPACQKALDAVLKNGQSFRVCFRGVTIAPNAVMIQGFPVDDELRQFRDKLRKAFAEHGLGGNLDRRYKTTTAHLTVMRFAKPEADWPVLHEFLQAHRETDFGETSFQSLQLIWSDWYASVETARVLQEYPLQ